LKVISYKLEVRSRISKNILHAFLKIRKTTRIISFRKSQIITQTPGLERVPLSRGACFSKSMIWLETRGVY